MSIDIKAARAAIAAATPGPWEVEDDGDWASIESSDGFAIAYTAEHKSMHTIRAQGRSNSLRDAEFISLARTALPAAIDEIERLRALLGGGPLGSFTACRVARNSDPALSIYAKRPSGFERSLSSEQQPMA